MAFPVPDPGNPALDSLPFHEETPTTSSVSPFVRLNRLIWPERRDLGIVILFAIGVGLLNLVAPLVTTAVLNTVVLGTLIQQLLILCTAMLFGLMLSALMQGMKKVCVEYLQRRVFVRVSAELAYRLPRVESRAFDQQHGPELVNRFFDVLTVQKAGATLLLDGLALFLQTIIGLILLAVYDSILLGFDLVLIGALLVLFLVLGRGTVSSAIKESKAKYAVAGWMEEVARHPVAFKLAGGPEFATAKAEHLTAEYLEYRRVHFRHLMRQIGFALFLQAVSNAALLAVGGWLVVRERLTPGQLVAAQLVVALVVASFAKFGKQLESYYDLLAAIDKLGSLTDLPLERGGGTEHRARSRGASLALHDVDFGYDERKRILSGFRVDIAPGECIAIVGPNGSGKSTLGELLFGLRSPDRGRIEIDGVDLRDVTLASFRSHAALVQGVEIFEGSLLANVRMGREGIGLEEVRDALRAVGLLDAVLGLPQGLLTPLWTGGRPLSLGQANRLMLARAMVGQPRLLILDESLDLLDPTDRDIVLHSLMRPEAPWTLVMITHRPDLAALCQRQIRLPGPDSIPERAP